MRKTAILLFALFSTTLAFARPVDLNSELQLAQNFWHYSLGQRSTLQHIACDKYDNILLFTSHDGGFIIMPSDDAVQPVLGYSTTQKLDINNLPIQLEELLNHYNEQIELIQQLGLTPSERTQSLRKQLQMKVIVKGGDSIEPLLETLWDQDPYYNDLCPTNTVAGCAAIAQAQVMRYWKWPIIGKGSHKYKYNGQILSADFGNTVYQWDLMPSQLDYTSSDKEIEATATLIYHIGVGLEMSYNSAANGGSGAIGFIETPGYPSINNSLKDYFYYKEDMQVISKSSGYNDSTWAVALIDDLKKKHPIVYTGHSTAGGHAFVCDGYETRLDDVYFHFNFGWSGIGDGYFTVKDICPNVSPTGEVGQTYHFNYSNQALLNCVPDYSMHVDKDTISFFSNGGVDSIRLSTNPTSETAWTVSCEQSWISIADTSLGVYNRISVTADENTTGIDRTATITISQGLESATIKVLQKGFSSSELCSLTVEMESTKGNGWRKGAHLSFEGLDGYPYGTAALEDGFDSIATILVAPHDINAVFHHAGISDYEINYRIKNSYGETLVEVTNAYKNGDTHFLEWPCAHVGIDKSKSAGIIIAPNPVLDQLTISGIASGEQISLLDMTGRHLIQSFSNEPTLNIDMRHLPAGVYVLLVGETIHKIIKQ